MDNISMEMLSRLFTGALTGLLGLAILLGSTKWALARNAIPWDTCDGTTKRCNVIRQFVESNCDALWNLNTQVPKNSNCEAQMDDYMYCLQKYCNKSNYEILRPFP